MQFRRLAVALKLPRKYRRMAFVVSERFAIGCLMLLAEMCAGRFVALQRVNAHQLGEFEEIRDAPGALPGLVLIFFISGNAHIVPEFVAQFRDFPERFSQSLFVTRHSAFVPEE